MKDSMMGGGDNRRKVEMEWGGGDWKGGIVGERKMSDRKREEVFLHAIEPQ